MNQAITAILSTAKAIERLLHPHAEVVLHDINTNTILAIYNPLSKRKVGDSSLVSEIEQMNKLDDCIGPYPKTNWNGRKMKSVSSVIRDNDGHAVAMLCINLDVSTLEYCQQFLFEFISPKLMQEQPQELFVDDWQDRINTYVHQYLSDNSLSLESINRQEKQQIVAHLNTVGAFSGKNAANYVANILKISRATVYKYLKTSTGE